MKFIGTALVLKWAFKVRLRAKLRKGQRQINCFFFLIAESWLKRRWHQLRTEYHNNNQNNPILSNHLSFLKKTKKGAAIGGGNMREDHQTEEGDEFHVTQEQLDESTGETSSNDENTINFDVDNESAESFEDYEVTIVSDAGDAVSNDLQTCETKNATKTKTITIEKVLERRVDTSKRKPAANLNVEKSPIALKASSEVNEVDYQDKVFGDLVSAMLAEMTPEKKKQARKEIMNILL